MPRPLSAAGTSVCRIGEGAAVAPVVGERDLAVGVELEALALRVVANVIGHGHVSLHNHAWPELTTPAAVTRACIMVR